MSQQGEHPRPEPGEEDDWWSRLYDPESSDTGRTRQEDTLDDRFASVSRTVGGGPALPAPRKAPDSRVPGPGPVPGSGLRPEPGPGAGPAPESGADSGPAAEQGPAGERLLAYEPEPGVLPAADPAALSELVPDTVLDSADHGAVSFRAVSLRGVCGREQGGLRGDVLLTARFGSGETGLLLLAVASGDSGTPGARRAAREVCRAIGGAVGRSHARLAEDMRGGRRSALKPGLNRLTDRIYGKLRAQAAALGLGPEEYTAGLRCLLLPADPRCTLRVFFGVEGVSGGCGDAGAGLFRLRDGAWQDVEPAVPGVTEARTATGPVGTTAAGSAVVPAQSELPALPVGGPWPADQPPAPAVPFRCRTLESRPGDVLLMCAEGFGLLCDGGEPLARRLADEWGGPSGPPGTAAFLAEVQSCADGHRGDRTVVAVWER